MIWGHLNISHGNHYPLNCYVSSLKVKVELFYITTISNYDHTLSNSAVILAIVLVLHIYISVQYTWPKTDTKTGKRTGMLGRRADVHKQTHTHREREREREIRITSREFKHDNE